MSTYVPYTKVKSDAPKAPATLGEWLDHHYAKCHRQWTEGRVGDYYVHRCVCGDKVHVTVANHPLGRAAPLSVKN